MNHNAKRIISALLAAALTFSLLMFTAAGCGKDKENGASPVGTADGSGSQQTVPADDQSEPVGKGFTANHAAASGFGMGSDTLADITTRFGQPDSSDRQDYSSLTLITANYPFGVMEFESDGTFEPVLTYVEIGGLRDAPCSLTLGSDIAECADTIYTGSSALFEGLPSDRIMLYGSEGSAPNGIYTFLTMEFVSSTSDDTYSLDYLADSYEDGKNINYTLYFDEQGKFIRYTLRYV